jgi:hypothetical protein
MFKLGQFFPLPLYLVATGLRTIQFLLSLLLSIAIYRLASHNFVNASGLAGVAIQYTSVHFTLMKYATDKLDNRFIEVKFHSSYKKCYSGGGGNEMHGQGESVICTFISLLREDYAAGVDKGSPTTNMGNCPR